MVTPATSWHWDTGAFGLPCCPLPREGPRKFLRCGRVGTRLCLGRLCLVSHRLRASSATCTRALTPSCTYTHTHTHGGGRGGRFSQSCHPQDPDTQQHHGCLYSAFFTELLEDPEEPKKAFWVAGWAGRHRHGIP